MKWTVYLSCMYTLLNHYKSTWDIYFSMLQYILNKVVPRQQNVILCTLGAYAEKQYVLSKSSSK